MHPGTEYARILLDSNRITLKVLADFEDNIDIAEFYYQNNDEWMKLGITHKLYFRLDHFVGCRIGLFLFSTKETGGEADFEHFVYRCLR